MTLPNELHPGFFSAGGGGDVGDTIEESLRFTNAAGPSLSRTMGTGDSRRKFTLSVWVKRGKLPSGDQNQIWNYHTNPNVCALGFQNNKLRFYHYDSGGTFNAQYVSTPVFRDPSAWYHIITVVDTTLSTATDRVKLWVNGARITAFDTQTTFSQDYDTFVGLNNYTNLIGVYADGSSFKFSGYAASMVFLDGIAASETDFGRYQEDGVWVPKNYSGSYGTNGYNLTFDSSQTNGIGHDSSGNGHNFTASGFDTADVRVYSNDLYSMTTGSGNWTTTTSKNWSSNTAATGFNGNLGNAVQVTTGDTWVWRPSYPLTATLVEVYPTNSSPNQKLYFNGTEVGGSYTGAAWNTVYTGSATTVNHIGGEFTGGGNGFYGIRVNGTILVDNRDNDVDFLDTPTSNYAVWNPLADDGTNVTLSEANLRIGTNSSATANWEPGYITFGPFECGKPGKYYFEMNDDDGTGYITCNFGVTDTFKNDWSGFWWDTGDTLSWYPENGGFYRNGSFTSMGTNSTTGGKAMAIDFENGTIDAYSGGTLLGRMTTLSSNLTSGKKYYIVAGTSQTNSTTLPFNFGQMPFIYTQPSGYKKLQTNNLPEATINNGRDHFDVALYTGNTTTPPTITGLNFQPDFIWIKIRSSSSNHSLYDSIRGVNGVICTSSDSRQRTDGTITPTADGFTVGADNSIIGSTNSNGHTYVAWCWKCDESFTPTVSGLTSPSGKRNKDAGFSMVSYNGNGTAGATFEHGLDQKPEFVMIKRRDADNDWITYQEVVGPTVYMSMNTAADATTASSGYFNNTSPTASTFTLGDSSRINNNGGTYIAYCWHSVPGYSKIGKFRGFSGSPFVQTGFRPSFVMIKRLNGGSGHWVMYDSVRPDNVTNPCDDYFFANDVSSEPASTKQIDIVSNGFRIVTVDSDITAPNDDYLYICFAENPFGGENVPPATAR